MYISLFGCAQVLAAIYRIFSCGMQNPVPWQGIKPGLSALGTQSLGSWTTREVLPLMLIHCSSLSPFILTIWVPRKYFLFGFVFLSEICSQGCFFLTLQFPPWLTWSTNDKTAPRKAMCVCQSTEAAVTGREILPSRLHAEDHGSPSTHQGLCPHPSRQAGKQRQRLWVFSLPVLKH